MIKSLNCHGYSVFLVMLIVLFFYSRWATNVASQEKQVFGEIGGGSILHAVLWDFFVFILHKVLPVSTILKLFLPKKRVRVSVQIVGEIRGGSILNHEFE